MPSSNPEPKTTERAIWEVTTVSGHPKGDYWADVRAVLAEGWEPFSVSDHRMYFRRIARHAE